MQHVCLDCQVNALVDVVSGVSQGSVLEPFLFILYTSKRFHIVENSFVGYMNDTKIYAVITTLLSRPQVIESLHQNVTAINSWCLKWHMRLYPRKIKSIVVRQC